MLPDDERKSTPGSDTKEDNNIVRGPPFPLPTRQCQHQIEKCTTEQRKTEQVEFRDVPL